MPRTDVKVTFDDGDHLNTGINLDLEGAKKYYLGNTFNLGIGPKDRMVKAVKVEEIKEGTPA